MLLRRSYGPPVAALGGPDADALLWRDAVVTNGGTVSADRLAIISTFIVAEKVAGTWALTDDYWGFWAESQIQALTSLKQRRLATAVNTPTFTTDRGYAFNGTTNYLDTGFVPSTHAVAMTGSNMRIAGYERANLAVTNSYTAGVNDGTNQGLRVGARTAGNVVVGAANCPATNIGSGIMDSRGLTALSRTAAGVFEIYKNGLTGGTAVPASTGTVLPIRSIGIGAIMVAGTWGGYRAATIGAVMVGASLSAAQELAQYNAVQAWATAVGAQV